jgi:hypothetical protein
MSTPDDLESLDAHVDSYTATIQDEILATVANPDAYVIAPNAGPRLVVGSASEDWISHLLCETRALRYEYMTQEQSATTREYQVLAQLHRMQDKIADISHASQLEQDAKARELSDPARAAAARFFLARKQTPLAIGEDVYAPDKRRRYDLAIARINSNRFNRMQYALRERLRSDTSDGMHVIDTYAHHARDANLEADRLRRALRAAFGGTVFSLALPDEFKSAMHARKFLPKESEAHKETPVLGGRFDLLQLNRTRVPVATSNIVADVGSTGPKLQSGTWKEQLASEAWRFRSMENLNLVDQQRKDNISYLATVLRYGTFSENAIGETHENRLILGMEWRERDSKEDPFVPIGQKDFADAQVDVFGRVLFEWTAIRDPVDTNPAFAKFSPTPDIWYVDELLHFPFVYFRRGALAGNETMLYKYAFMLFTSLEFKSALLSLFIGRSSIMLKAPPNYELPREKIAFTSVVLDDDEKQRILRDLLFPVIRICRGRPLLYHRDDENEEAFFIKMGDKFDFRRYDRLLSEGVFYEPGQESAADFQRLVQTGDALDLLGLTTRISDTALATSGGFCRGLKQYFFNHRVRSNFAYELAQRFVLSTAWLTLSKVVTVRSPQYLTYWGLSSLVAHLIPDDANRAGLIAYAVWVSTTLALPQIGSVGRAVTKWLKLDQRLTQLSNWIKRHLSAPAGLSDTLFAATLLTLEDKSLETAYELWLSQQRVSDTLLSPYGLTALNGPFGSWTAEGARQSLARAIPEHRLAVLERAATKTLNGFAKDTGFGGGLAPRGGRDVLSKMSPIDRARAIGPFMSLYILHSEHEKLLVRTFNAVSLANWDRTRESLGTDTIAAVSSTFGDYYRTKDNKRHSQQALAIRLVYDFWTTLVFKEIDAPVPNLNLTGVADREGIQGVINNFAPVAPYPHHVALDRFIWELLYSIAPEDLDLILRAQDIETQLRIVHIYSLDGPNENPDVTALAQDMKSDVSQQVERGNVTQGDFSSSLINAVNSTAPDQLAELYAMYGLPKTGDFDFNTPLRTVMYLHALQGSISTVSTARPESTAETLKHFIRAAAALVSPAEPDIRGDSAERATNDVTKSSWWMQSMSEEAIDFAARVAPALESSPSDLLANRNASNRGSWEIAREYYNSIYQLLPTIFTKMKLMSADEIFGRPRSRTTGKIIDKDLYELYLAGKTSEAQSQLEKNLNATSGLPDGYGNWTQTEKDAFVARSCTEVGSTAFARFLWAVIKPEEQSSGLTKYTLTTIKALSQLQIRTYKMSIEAANSGYASVRQIRAYAEALRGWKDNGLVNYETTQDLYSETARSIAIATRESDYDFEGVAALQFVVGGLAFNWEWSWEQTIIAEAIATGVHSFLETAITAYYERTRRRQLAIGVAQKPNNEKWWNNFVDFIFDQNASSPFTDDTASNYTTIGGTGAWFMMTSLNAINALIHAGAYAVLVPRLSFLSETFPIWKAVLDAVTPEFLHRTLNSLGSLVLPFAGVINIGLLLIFGHWGSWIRSVVWSRLASLTPKQKIMPFIRRIGSPLVVFALITAAGYTWQTIFENAVPLTIAAIVAPSIITTFTRKFFAAQDEVRRRDTQRRGVGSVLAIEAAKDITKWFNQVPAALPTTAPPTRTRFANIYGVSTETARSLPSFVFPYSLKQRDGDDVRALVNAPIGTGTIVGVAIPRLPNSVMSDELLDEIVQGEPCIELLDILDLPLRSTLSGADASLLI